MARLIFVFFYLGINLFRLIPFSVLYAKSYGVYVILYYLVGYRKQVVFDNLSKSFTEKSESEVKKLCKAFYKHNLAPIFAEGLKGFTMNKKQFLKRYKVLNPEVLNPYFEKGQDVIALASHYANWEWGIQAVDMQIEHQSAALYKPMSNKHIEKYAKGLREKFGMELVSIFETREYFEKKKAKPVVYIMAADQNPGNVKKAYWVNFLNRDTACLHGPENYAKYNNLPMVFFDVQRVKKGHYTLEIKPLVEQPDNFKPGEITQKYMHELDQVIQQKPENWLWSHKRWKHKRK